jgi:hypothetical protein
MNRLLIFVVALSCAGFSAANAEQYWIAYEGDDFPENVGWERTFGDGHNPPQDEPDRWLENGHLVIDTSRNGQLWEYYSHALQDPSGDELFAAQWRVRADLFSGTHDNGVVIARGDVPGHVAFYLREGLLEVATDGVLIPIAPDVSHEYYFQSPDMTSYSLSIDGELAYTGYFETDTFLQGYLAFGAGTQGARSRSYWDYMRFGVVPEADTFLLWMTGTILAWGSRKR